MRADVLEYLNQLCEIDNHIYDLYNILINLEKEGNKGSKAYNGVVQLLYLAIEEEKALLTFFEIYPDLAVEAFVFVFQNKPVENNDDLIITQNKNNLLKARLYKNLLRIVNSLPEYFTVDIDQFFLEAFDNEDHGVIYSYLYEILPVLSGSTSIRMAGFLGDMIKGERNDNIKDFLIKARYYLALIDTHLETLFLKNGFNKVPDTFEAEIRTTSYEDELDEEIKAYIKSEHGIELVYSAIKRLKDYTDNYNKRLLNWKHIIIFVSLLKTGLLYLSEDRINVIYDELMEETTDASQEFYEIIDYIFNSAPDTYIKVNKDLNQEWELN